MASIFKDLKVFKPKRNVFDLSHERKMSLNMGDLVPILCQEVVPGDTFKNSSEIFMRLAPMIAPVMHRVNVYTHFFFVPNRLVWKDWGDFITGYDPNMNPPVPPDPPNSAKPLPVFPQIALSDLTLGTRFTNGSLADYLGFPTMIAGDIPPNGLPPISQLPFRAYQLIWNEYYRDQNLQSEINFSRDGVVLGTQLDAAELDRITTLRKRCWEKDYFTSALPWAQKGGDVMIPVSGSGNIVFNPSGYDINNGPRWEDVGPLVERANIGALHATSGLTSSGTSRLNSGAAVVTGTPVAYNPNGTLKVAGDVDTGTIEDLRRASRLQAWLEKNARGGSRYIEQLFAHFGVKSSDARLQRPEYLGGGKSPVIMSEVLQTSETQDGISPQGNMAGHGFSVGKTHYFEKYFEEHGYIIGIMSVLPRTAYHQGIPKHFLKQDKFDYFWPDFAHLGEQPILNSEVYVGAAQDDPTGTFGYTPRYAEYKFTNSSVHGEMRDSLDFWHLGRKFEGKPNLNAQFVSSDPDKRIFAVEDEQYHMLYCHLFNNTKAIRGMPRFGTPGSHFF